MCLKEWHTFTFTNYEAFKRAVRIINRDRRYGSKVISGRIFFILDYLTNEIMKLRESETYEVLERWWTEGSLMGSSGTIHGWEYFQGLVRMLKKRELKGDKIDIFGKIKIELR